ncbi:hypothetical protein [Tamlana flava]|uniref:hypothetical protein n=1 Tax=Tamlana flava TaxID=3158572 RepID=UPI00351B084A
MSIADWIQTIGLFIAFIGIGAGVYYNRRQLKELNKHLRLQFFSEYTKRYQEIMLNLPEDIMSDDFNIKKLDKKDYSKTMRYLRAYLDLCSEEYDLWLSGNLEERVWMNWEQGIRSKFSNKSFRRAWDRSSYDSFYYADFNSWMNNVILKDVKN